MQANLFRYDGFGTPGVIRTPYPLFGSKASIFYSLHLFLYFSYRYTNSGNLLSLKSGTHFPAFTYCRKAFCYGFVTFHGEESTAQVPDKLSLRFNAPAWSDTLARIGP
jgi:hypothetical protein